MLRSLRRTHPSYELLSRAADRELPAVEAMEVNAHLAECRECRREVDFMIDLRGRLRKLTGPELPPALLPEILEQRAAGERRILDMGEVLEDEEARGAVRPAIPAAAAVAILAAGFGLFAARGADAGAGAFELEVADGSLVAAIVETRGERAAESQLKLRIASYERAPRIWEDAVPVTTERAMIAVEPGRFETALAGAPIYARFSAESPAGEIVPIPGRALEHLARGSDGAPTRAALTQKVRSDLDALDIWSAIEAARELTGRFQDEPEAWYWRWEAEEQAGLADAAEHAARLRRFAEEAPTSPDPDRIASTIAYAMRVEQNSETTAALLPHLEALDPGHPMALALRTTQALQRGEFSAVEELWNRYGSIGGVYNPLVTLAGILGEPAEAVKWFDRWVRARPGERLEAAALLAQVPGLGPEGIAQIERALRAVASEGVPRPVGTSLAEHRDAIAGDRIGAALLLMEILRGRGELAAAYQALAWAEEWAWRGDVIVPLAALATELGQIDDAIRHHVVGSILPGGDDEAGERHLSALRTLGVTPGEVGALQEAARDRLRGTMLTASALRLSGWVPVHDEAGIQRNLADRLGPVTILHFGSARSATTRERIEQTIAHCSVLDRNGIRVLRVSNDAPETPAGAAGCASEWWVDRDRAVRNAVDSRRLNEILVLDADGRVRFRTSEPALALQAALLLTDAPVGLSTDPR